MQRVGVAYVEILPKLAPQFGGQVARDVERDTVSPLRKTFASVGMAAKIGLAAAGTGLAALGAYGVKSAAGLQQTRIAFEGVLGGAKEADAYLLKLRDFAARTPFEFPQLTRAAQQLMGVGFAAEDVIPNLTAIGNVASALGAPAESIDRIVRALGQMKGKGKASAEELMQISEALPGFSAVEAIASSLGVTTGEAFKLMERGAVSADQSIAAIIAGMKRFKGAAGAMERQSKTLTGVMSTLKDNFRDALTDGIEPILPAVSGTLAKVGPVIGKTVGGFAGQVGKSLTAILPAITSVLESIGPALGPIAAIFGKVIGGGLQAIAPIIKQAVPLVTRFIGQIGKVFEALLPAVEPLGQVFLALAGTFVTLIDSAMPLLDALLPLVVIFAKVAAVVLVKLAPALDVLAPAIVAAVVAFKALKAINVAGQIVKIGSAFAKVGMLMMANPFAVAVAAVVALGVALYMAYKKFKPFRDLVDRVGRALRSGFGAAVKATVRWVRSLAAAFRKGGLSGVLKLIVRQLGRLGSAVIGWIGTMAPKLGRLLGRWGAAFLAWLGPASVKLVGALGRFLGKVLAWAGQALPTLVRAMGRWAGAALRWIVEAVRQAPGALSRFLAAVTSWALRAVGKLATVWARFEIAALRWIVEAVRKAPGRLARLYLAIFDWVKATVPKVQDALGDFAVAALRWVGEAVRKAPGRLWHLGQAIKDWIHDTAPKIGRAAGRLGEAILDGMVEGMRRDPTGGMGDAFKKALTGAWNWLVREFNSAWNNWNIDLGWLGHFGLPEDAPLGALKLHTGGVVPGLPGEEVLAVLQAGERVVPAPTARRDGQQQVNVTQNLYSLDARRLARMSADEIEWSARFGALAT